MTPQEKAEASIVVGVILFGLLILTAFVGTGWLLITTQF